MPEPPRSAYPSLRPPGGPSKREAPGPNESRRRRLATAVAASSRPNRNMDNRQSPRRDADQPVIVTELDSTEPAQSAHLTNFSTHGLGLFLEKPLPVGAPVKVEWATTLLLGEVIYCVAREGRCVAGLRLVDALYDTDAINRSGD